MMEFTYQGIVRQGFGFYNPNHAAALICAVMPLITYRQVVVRRVPVPPVGHRGLWLYHLPRRAFTEPPYDALKSLSPIEGYYW
jgi:hypothetical protein